MRQARDAQAAERDEPSPVRLNGDLALVWRLLGRQIAFHRRLVDLTASVKAALLLSQAIYWTRHGRGIVPNGGWFYKTIGQWQIETALSAKEQAGARSVLRELGIIVEKRAGVPAKLHLRVELDQLGALLSGDLDPQAFRVTWDDSALVARVLGPSLSFHCVLAAAAGGVNAGLMLSRALYLTRRQSRDASIGWICSSAALWRDDIGLTRREQESARRDLVRLGLWEEAMAGMPPRNIARIKLAVLLARLAEQARSVAALAPPVSGNPTYSVSQKGETRLWESHNLVSPKAPSLFPQNRHHSYAQSAKLLVLRSTSTSVQPPPQGAGLTDVSGTQASSGGDLIFPEGLSPEEKAAASALALRCPDQAQALLDELAARMRAGAVQTSPIAYLRGMVTRAKAGTFIPELGHRVAVARKRGHEEALARAQREEEERQRAAERASPDYPAKVAKRRAEVRAMLDAIQARRPRRDTL